MCFVPKNLKNPIKKENKTGFDKPRIKAPCNNCPQCRKAKSRDWTVRAYYEFLDNHRKAYFLSLDFDNYHLPRFRGQPCFDSQKMKLFLDRLRYYIGKFRYLYVSEYGGLLKRPHYHVILLPADLSIQDNVVFNAVQKSWTYGHHTNIETIASIDGDKMKAIRYVSSYATKDITFDVSSVYPDMPLYYRPRIQASKGFGEAPLLDGRITLDMLLNGTRLALPLGKNGKLVNFNIPRYYEMKLTYDYYINEDGHSAQKKNEYGVQLAKIRHNGNFVYYVKEFFASRWQWIPSPFFDASKWYEVVSNCLSNYEDFKEYVYYRNFIEFRNGTWYRDSLRDEVYNRPNWDYYDSAFNAFLAWRDDLKSTLCRIETEKLVESAKQRAREKIKRSPELRRYLFKVNFDWNLLKPKIS